MKIKLFPSIAILVTLTLSLQTVSMGKAGFSPNLPSQAIPSPRRWAWRSS